MSVKDFKSIRNKKPWPTKKAMQQVYEMNLWGGDSVKFYSGEGSHDITIVKPYLTALISFFKSFKNPMTVCDLGCGDFNVGKELVKYTQHYIAVDIVPELINYNKSIFKEDKLEFQCLDIAVDDLPSADCVIIRQVLQHLSNAEVQNVVRKLSKYKYVVLTEHLPEGDFIPNKDIISGQGIRLKMKSGVNLLTAPFNLKVKDKKELLSITLNNSKGVIVTSLYEMF
ncbi:MAG: class I SAM-dependent methyltransferase [Tenacibaculum sp.]